MMPNAPEPTPNHTSSESEIQFRIDMKQASSGGAQEGFSTALLDKRSCFMMLLGLINNLPPELKLMIFALLTIDPIYAYVFSQTFGLEEDWIKESDGILSNWRNTFLAPDLVRLETASARLATQPGQANDLTEYSHCYGFRSTILWERSKKFKIEEWAPDQFADLFERGHYFRRLINGESDWRAQCDHWVHNLYMRHHNHCHGRTPLNGTWRDTVRDCILHCDLRAWWKTQYKSDFVAITLEKEVMENRTVSTPCDGKHTDHILMTVGNLAIYQKYAALWLLAGPATELEPYDIPMKVHRDFFRRGNQCAKRLDLDRDVQHQELWKEMTPPQPSEPISAMFALGGDLWECAGLCLTRLD